MKLLLIFLMVAYFFFKARETALVDMSSRVSEIVDVRSDVLVNFLIVLARVVDAVAPSSHVERFPSPQYWSAKRLRLGWRLDLGVVDQ